MGSGGERVKGQRCQLVTLGHPGLFYCSTLLVSDIPALWCSAASARISEIKNGRLDLDGIEDF